MIAGGKVHLELKSLDVCHTVLFDKSRQPSKTPPGTQSTLQTKSHPFQVTQSGNVQHLREVYPVLSTEIRVKGVCHSE